MDIDTLKQTIRELGAHYAALPEPDALRDKVYNA